MIIDADSYQKRVVSMQAHLHGASLTGLMTRNIDKLEKRKQDGTLVGTGSDR